MELWIMGARLAFGDGIYEKKAFAGEPGGKADYNAKFILPVGHKQIGEIEKAEAQVAKDKWGAKADANLKVVKAKGRSLLKDGSTQRSDGFADNLFVSARADTRPTVVGRDRSPKQKGDNGAPYSGCYVNVKLDVWAQDNQWGQGINATLLGVQFVRDGDSFAAGAPPANPDDFPDLGVEDDGGDSLFD